VPWRALVTGSQNPERGRARVALRTENPRPEKVAQVREVRERLSSSSASLLTEYRGLTVGDLGALRRSLAAAGGEYRVFKNTLVRFAAAELGLEGLDSLLTGPTAIAFVDGDAAEVAKALRDFARTHPALVVKGGVLGSQLLSSSEAAALADLPSRDVMLARLAGAFSAPLQQLAGLLAALPRNFAYGLKALLDQGGATAGSGSSVSTGLSSEGAEQPEPSQPVAEGERVHGTEQPEPSQAAAEGERVHGGEEPGPSQAAEDVATSRSAEEAPADGEPVLPGDAGDQAD